MRLLYILLLAAGCGAARAQAASTASTNLPAAPTEITSDSAVFDYNTRRIVYMGDVRVTDPPKLKLRCERLTVDLPSSGQPTNAVAETNVVIDFLGDKGETNHVTSDRAVYTYGVVNSVTNETIKFTGHPLVRAAEGTISSEPLIWDKTANQFYFYSYKMLFNHSLTGSTNGLQPKLF